MKLLTRKFLFFFVLQMICLFASIVFYGLFMLSVLDDYGMYTSFFLLCLVYLLAIQARRELSERLALIKKKRLARYGR